MDASTANNAKDAKRPRAEEEGPAGWEDLVPPAKKQPPPQKYLPSDDEEDEPIILAQDINPGDEVKYRHSVGGAVVGILEGTVLAVIRNVNGGVESHSLKVISVKLNGGKITRTIALNTVIAHTPPEVDSDDEEEEEEDESPFGVAPAPEVAPQGNDDNSEFSDSDEGEASDDDEADDPKDLDYEEEREAPPRPKAPKKKPPHSPPGDDDDDDADYSESHSEESEESEESESDEEEPVPQAPVARAKLVLGGEPSGYDSEADEEAARATRVFQRRLLRRPRKQGQPPLKNQGKDQAKQYRGWIAALLKVKPIPSESDEEDGADPEDWRPYHSYRTLQHWRNRMGRGTHNENRVRDHIARAFELDRGRVEQAKYVGQTMCALNLLKEIDDWS